MQCDVVIVGAGPVGLMLATLLQRAEVSYVLLERRQTRDYWCKALGVSPRTLEIFDQLGILDEALDRGLFFRALNTVVNGKTVSRLEIEEGKYPYGNFGLSQFETEEILESDLRCHGGRISHGLEFESLEQDEAGVRVGLAGGRQLSGRYLVGCDGAHSQVRKQLGLAFEGDRYAPKFMLGDVELDWDRPHPEVWKFVTEEHGLCVVVPIAGHPQRYRVSMQTPEDLWDTPTDEPPSLELLRQRLPAELNIRSMRWSSFYSVSHRLVSAYRSGRVFLAGDAAHIHPPIGGLGMNTGLQDAHNLAWKLAEVLHGRSPESLLDSYHAERHKIGGEVVALTAARMDKQKLDPEAEERANTQLFLDYQGLPWCQGVVPEGHLGAEPGQRLDFLDGLERLHVQRQVRLIEMLRHSGWTMLSYAGARLLPGLANCRTYAISAQPPADSEVPWLRDAAGLAQQTWGSTPGIILVRPDGYVGWRGTPQDRAGLKSYLAAVVH